MRHRRYLYRRRGRSCPGSREIPPGGRRRFDHRHALLVLRLRNHGHGPVPAQSGLGFNGTERPGAVYLAAVLAGHNQKGLPAFGIYGRDVQDASDTTIPADVQEKLLQFARAGLAVASARQILSVDGRRFDGHRRFDRRPAFFESYLGMRVEAVDMSEITRRIEEGIYDPEEFKRALAWTKDNCTEGREYNPPEKQRTRATERQGLGDRGQDDHDRPRLDDRQPASGRVWVGRGSPGA